jgi:hypothetical protein
MGSGPRFAGNDSQGAPKNNEPAILRRPESGAPFPLASEALTRADADRGYGIRCISQRRADTMAEFQGLLLALEQKNTAQESTALEMACAGH